MCCFTQRYTPYAYLQGDTWTDAQTHRRTDGRMDGRRGNIYSIFRDKLLLRGEHVYSCGVVSVFLVLAGNSFWYICTYHTVVALCQFFWFWQEIVFGVMYVLSVQYSCAVVFLKNDYLVSLIQRNNSLANVCFLLNPNFVLLRISFLFSINQHLYSHDLFSKYIKTYQCMQKSVNNQTIP